MVLPPVWCNLQYPERETFEQLSKRRLVEISKLVWRVRKEKYRDKYNCNHHARKRDWELSVEQLEALFSAFMSRKYLVLFRLQFLLALRISEVIGLRWNDVDEKEGVVWITNSKSKDIERFPLLPEVRRILAGWRMRCGFDCRLSEWVFPAELNGGHVSYVLADKRFKEACRRAGLPEWVHPHCLRHSRISQFYRHTKNWELTRMFARHVSAKTTFDYYVHASQIEFVEALEDFSVAGRCV